MQILRICEKCGEEFWAEYGHTIDTKLCKVCFEKWGKFFQRNRERLERDYPQLENPMWSAFVSELPKERVLFT